MARLKRKRTICLEDLDYITISRQVETFNKKQQRMKEFKEKMNKRKLVKEQQELIYYQLLKFFRCVKVDDEEEDDKRAKKVAPENQEFEQQKER